MVTLALRAGKFLAPAAMALSTLLEKARLTAVCARTPSIHAMLPPVMQRDGHHGPCWQCLCACGNVPPCACGTCPVPHIVLPVETLAI